jgi:hypothetical protein
VGASGLLPLMALVSLRRRRRVGGSARGANARMARGDARLLRRASSPQSIGGTSHA